MAEAAEAGMGLLTGAIPAVPRPVSPAGAGGRRPSGCSGCGSGSGLPLATAADQAVITPGLRAGRRVPGPGRAALTRCREAAAMLPELIEETGGSQHD